MTWIFTPYHGDTFIKVIGEGSQARKHMNANYDGRWELQLTEKEFKFMEYLYEGGCSQTIEL